MVPRLVPEILSKCAFCDEAVGAVAVGIGDSRSLISTVLKQWSLENFANYTSFIVNLQDLRKIG